MLRLTPSLLVGSRAPAIVERNLIVYRRSWLLLLSGLLEPLFYLLSLGVGVGRLVGDVTGPGGQTISYAAFVAPAMLASSIMNGAIIDTSFNVFFKLKYAKVYDAVLSTPVSPPTSRSARSPGRWAGGSCTPPRSCCSWS